MSGGPGSGFCPYKGLQPYTEADRAYFFGRERDQEIIASNLYAAPLTVLYGASGVGKSSVLLAGVVPKLRQTPRLAIVVFRDWQNPEFQTELMDEVRRETERSLGRPCGVASELPFDEFLAACARGLRGPVFLVLDQFEEYFLYHPSDDGFDVAFARAVNREEAGVSFLLSMREDGISKLDRFQGRIPNLLANLLRLDYLDREAATHAIRRPLDEYNRRLPAGETPVVIEDELVETLLRDLRTGRVTLDQAGQGQTGAGAPAAARIETPFLQLVLTRLWQEEREAGSGRLRAATLARLGGTENIARTHLDTAMQELSDSERDVAARMFRFLVTPSGAKIAQDLASLTAWSEVGEDTARSVLLRLTAGTRILRAVSAAGQPDRYEIFHDVLAPAILDWRRRYAQAQALREAEKQAAEQRKRAEQEARAASRLRWLAGALAIVILLVLAIAAVAIRAQRAAIAAQELAKSQRQAALLAKDHEAVARNNAERERRRAEAQTAAAERAKDEADVAKNAAEEQRANAETQERIAQSRELAAAAEKSLEDDLGKLLAMEAVQATRSVDGTVTNEARDVLERAVGGAKVQVSLPGHQGEIIDLAYSPDGSRVATHSQDGTMKIWDAAAGQLLKTLSWPVAFYNTPGISFSNDGKRVAARWELGVSVRDVSSGVERLSARGWRGSIAQRFALSPDGERLATVNSDEIVRLWRSPDGTEPVDFPDESGVHETWRANVAFSADGAQLIIVRSRLATVVDAASGAVLRTIPLSVPNDGSATLSSSGRRLATALNGEIKVWNVENGEELPALQDQVDGITTLAFSADGSRLAAGDEKHVFVWDVDSGAKVLERSISNLGALAVSPQGERLALNTGDTSFFVVDVAKDSTVLESWGVQEMKMRGVAFSPDRRRVAVTSDKGMLRVWEIASGREEMVVAANAVALAFSPDGKTVAAVKQNEGVVALYDSASGRLLQECDHRDSLFRAAFTPDGSRLATVGNGHAGRFFDAASGHELFLLSGNTSRFSLAFSPEGRRLATGGLKTEIWDIASRSPIHTLETRGMNVMFSPDGRRLALAWDNTLVFDASSGKRLFEVTGGARSDLALQGAANVAFSPDGNLLATAQEDNTVKIWDARTGAERMTLYGHAGTVRGIAFSADGSRLIAVTDDWNIHVHPLHIEDLMALARSRVDRELTAEERKKYLHQP